MMKAILKTFKKLMMKVKDPMNLYVTLHIAILL